MYKNKASVFSKNFKWGVASSAYQSEGAWNIDGKAPSIWDTFTNKKSFKKGNGNDAAAFYFNYKEDIDAIATLNLTEFRFSIAWPRVIPKGIGKRNPEGIAFYHNVIDYCLEKNIQPWITLYHWDLPQTLQDKGGWTNREIVTWFSKYVDFCTKEYGGKVKNWMILNEPMSFVGLGYFLSEHAPKRRGLKNFLPAAHHTVLCQAEGGRITRKNIPNAYIGTTFSCSHVSPKNILRRNIKAAKRVDALLNRFFIEPALGLGYPLDVLPGLKKIEKYILPGDDEKMKFDFDFIGIQYYFRIVAQYSLLPPILYAKEIPARKRHVKVNTMGMEIYHKGLYKILKKFNTYKGVRDIYITEGGTCLDDPIINNEINDIERIKYFKKTFKQTYKAIHKGINIKGYFIWTLVDNFEWAEGIKPRFGIIHNNFKTQKRTFKKSAYWLQSFLTK